LGWVGLGRVTQNGPMDNSDVTNVGRAEGGMHLAPGAAGEGGRITASPGSDVTHRISGHDTIRYEIYFNVRSKADMNQLNQPHGNDN